MILLICSSNPLSELSILILKYSNISIFQYNDHEIHVLCCVQIYSKKVKCTVKFQVLLLVGNYKDTKIGFMFILRARACKALLFRLLIKESLQPPFFSSHFFFCLFFFGLGCEGWEGQGEVTRGIIFIQYIFILSKRSWNQSFLINIFENELISGMPISLAEGNRSAPYWYRFCFCYCRLQNPKSKNLENIWKRVA